MMDPTALLILWLFWATWWHRASGIPEEMRIDDHIQAQSDCEAEHPETQAHLVWAGDGPVLAAQWLGARNG